MIQVSVPLKLILFGEHFGVSGFPMTAVPLDYQFHLELKKINGSDVIHPQIDHKYHETLLADLTLVKKRLYISQGFEVSFRSEIPPGMGAGVSAAWSGALVEALSTAISIDEASKLQLIEQLELSHHGQISGMDHQVIFHRQGIMMKDKVIEQFFDIRASELSKNMYILVGQPPNESTRAMVQAFQQDFSFEDLTDEDRNALIHSDETFLDILESGDRDEFINFINFFGRRLEAFGVVPEESMIDFEEFRVAGGGAKICGAGGKTGGFGLGLCVYDDENFVRDFWAERGVEVERFLK